MRYYWYLAMFFRYPSLPVERWKKVASQLWSAETRLCPCLDAISQDLGEFPLLHRKRTNEMKWIEKTVDEEHKGSIDHFGAWEKVCVCWCFKVQGVEKEPVVICLRVILRCNKTPVMENAGFDSLMIKYGCFRLVFIAFPGLLRILATPFQSYKHQKYKFIDKPPKCSLKKTDVG